MKNNKIILIVLILVLGVSFNSCDDVLKMDLLDNPNDITEDKADLNRFLNSIQIDFASFTHSIGNKGAELTRIEQMSSRNYINAYTGTSSDYVWALAYQNMFSDMKVAEKLATETEANKHLGVMGILKAYSLLTLVDFFGDIPYSQATQPDEFPFPTTDTDESVYAAALDILDESISNLEKEGESLSFDLFYDNDFDKWIKLANTLKMKIFVTTRLVDADAISKFNAIVNSSNYISSSADDFQFYYGKNSTDPNTRHPIYSMNYTSGGVSGSSYRSNWLMGEMIYDEDPRIRYYFYRQTDKTPGGLLDHTNPSLGTVPPNQVTLPCSQETSKPPHYLSDMPYCSLPEGYWGRDHGFFGGIPPDGLRKTAAGVYPFAGKFDDDDFAPVGEDQGGSGAGITPIMLASWVDLMKAEMAMANSPALGASHLEASLIKSIDKVMSFASLDPDADLSMAPSSSDVSNYIANVIGDFNSADDIDKWNIFGKQFMVAHYGNGIDAYNFYRRTGYPTSLQFTVDAQAGGFIRSFFYPSNEADVNNNITQKEDVLQQVFWDTNASYPSFPLAN